MSEQRKPWGQWLLFGALVAAAWLLVGSAVATVHRPVGARAETGVSLTYPTGYGIKAARP